MKEFVHPTDVSHIDIELERFMNKHGIIYNSVEEREHRHHVFMQNLRFIHSKNRAQLGYTLAVNHLSDKTDDELSTLRGFRSSGVYNGGEPFPHELTESVLSDLPDEYDWRLYGAVNAQSTVYYIQENNKNHLFCVLGYTSKRSICMRIMLVVWYEWSHRRCTFLAKR